MDGPNGEAVEDQDAQSIALRHHRRIEQIESSAGIDNVEGVHAGNLRSLFRNHDFGVLALGSREEQLLPACIEILQAFQVELALRYPGECGREMWIVRTELLDVCLLHMLCYFSVRNWRTVVI